MAHCKKGCALALDLYESDDGIFMGQPRLFLFIFILSHSNSNDKYTIWTI